MRYGGALSREMILDLYRGDFLKDIDEENVRPASLDMALSGEGYRVNGAFLPQAGEMVREALDRVGSHKLSGTKKLLERGCCYVFKLREVIQDLPERVYAYCNPKSSSGRVDMHVRVLADGVARYDFLPTGYKGELWLLISPKTFPVIVSEGLTLSQMRFCNEDTRLDELRLETRFASNGGLLYTQNGSRLNYKELRHSDRDGSVLLTLGLQYEFPGFEAIESGEPLDLSLREHYDPHHFFRMVDVVRNEGIQSICLKAGTFYILSSSERVRNPPDLACEMRPMDERSGDIRSHYAGFIDPGWGVGADSAGIGRPLTLEVRSFEAGLIIVDGQPIAKIRFERMIQKPEKHYEETSPTYGGQAGPQLGKHFLPWVA